jgi:hypothetical protein
MSVTVVRRRKVGQWTLCTSPSSHVIRCGLFWTSSYHPTDKGFPRECNERVTGLLGVTLRRRREISCVRLAEGKREVANKDRSKLYTGALFSAGCLKHPREAPSCPARKTASTPQSLSNPCSKTQHRLQPSKCPSEIHTMANIMTPHQPNIEDFF